MVSLVGGVGLFLGRVIMLAGVSLLLVEGLSRLGDRAAGLVRSRAPGPLEGVGVGFLIGWAVLGTGFLGLALTGLFSAAPLWGGLILAVLAAGRGRALLPAALRAAGRPGLRGVVTVALLAAPFILFIAFLLVPEFELDCERYHLGAPWQYLMAHRLLFTHVPATFHLTMPVDLVFALPLLLGDDRLAKWLVAASFTAAGCVFLERLDRGRAPFVLAAGVLLALSASHLAWLVGMSKNDVPAAALFIAGALLSRSGNWPLAGALLGCSVAAKLVYGPVVAAWLLFHPPPRRVLVPVAIGLIVPLLPWLAKGFLATGNPVYPFAYEWFPSLGWGELNQVTGLDGVTADHPDTVGLARLPRGWARVMSAEFTAVAVALPGLLFFSRERRPALALVAASLVVLAATHISRYLVPVAWALILLAAKEADRLPRILRTAALGGMAAYALARLAVASEVRWPDWRDAFRATEAVLDRNLTTRREAIAALAGLRGNAAAPRVLSLGEDKTNRYPARLVYGGIQGETPLAWSLARSSRDAAELRKRFKQLGVDAILYNFDCAEWLGSRYRGFAWEAAALRRYVDFLKRHAEPVSRPRQLAHPSGGFYLFRINARPLVTPSPDVWFVPGAEAVFGYANRLRHRGRWHEALAVYRSILEAFPDIGHVWNEVGRTLLLLGRHREALEHLERYGRAGVMDTTNLIDYGAAALAVGKLELAGRVFEDALDRYPVHRRSVLENLAVLKVNRALVLVREGSAAGAARLLDGAEADLARYAEAFPGQRPDWIRTCRALVLGCRGEVALARGDGIEAAARFRAAAELVPHDGNAARWRKLADGAEKRGGRLGGRGK